MVRHVSNVRVNHRITDHLDWSHSQLVIRGARSETGRLLVRASDQDVQCTHIAVPESELRIIDDSDALRTPIHSGTIVSNVKTVCEDGSLGQVRCTSLLTLSDVRTKDSCTRIPDGACLQNTPKLLPTKFVYKHAPSKPVRGLLAHEAESYSTRGDDGLLRLDYTRISAEIIGAIRAQQKQIDELRQLIQDKL
jgi:hypothetical protein